MLCKQALTRHKVENQIKIYFIVLCNQILRLLKVKKIIFKKISYIVLWNQILSLLMVKNHVKISFIMLYNQVLSDLKMENYQYLTKKEYLIVQLLRVEWKFPD